jgi:hypothetical protein
MQAPGPGLKSPELTPESRVLGLLACAPVSEEPMPSKMTTPRKALEELLLVAGREGGTA